MKKSATALCLSVLLFTTPCFAASLTPYATLVPACEHAKKLCDDGAILQIVTCVFNAGDNCVQQISDAKTACEYSYKACYEVAAP